jgi:hypothetical protein
MKRVLLATAALALIWATGQAKADIYDPLLLTCTGCTGTGSFVGVPGGSVTGLEVFSAPAQSGDLQLKILVPTNEVDALSFTASGTSTGTFTQHAGTFSSGSLEVDFLGETLAGGAPPNQFTTLQDQSIKFDAGITSYTVFLFDVGQVSLQTPGGTSPVDINLSPNLPAGTWVLGDLFLANGTVVTTATSEGLLSVPGPAAGAGIPGVIAALGLLGFGRLRRKRHAV